MSRITDIERGARMAYEAADAHCKQFFAANLFLDPDGAMKFFFWVEILEAAEAQLLECAREREAVRFASVYFCPELIGAGYVQ